MHVFKDNITSEWLKKIESTEKKLKNNKIESVKAAKFWKELGYLYQRVSRQSKSVNDFRKKRQKSVTAYEKAGSLYKQSSKPFNLGLSYFCFALAEYVRSWLKFSNKDKKLCLKKSCDYGKKVIELIRPSQDELILGKANNILSLSYYDLLLLSSNKEERKIFAENANKNSKIAVEILSKYNDDELVFALSRASILNWYIAYVFGTHEQWIYYSRRSTSYAKQAFKISKLTNDSYLIAESLHAIAWSNICFTDTSSSIKESKEKIRESEDYAREMLKHAYLINDNYLQGLAYDLINTSIFWLSDYEADLEKKNSVYLEIRKNSVKSIKSFQLVCKDAESAIASVSYVESLLAWSKNFAIDRESKLRLANIAKDLALKAERYANRSMSPDARRLVFHILSKVYSFQSKLEFEKEEKWKLLIKAKNKREDTLKIEDDISPSNSRAYGTSYVFKGKIQSDLANLESNKNRKKKLLNKAIFNIKKGLKILKEWNKNREEYHQRLVIANHEDAYASILVKIYELTQEELTGIKDVYLINANKSLESAKDKFEKEKLPHRVAENLWKMGINNDILGLNSQAAKNFYNASKYFELASEKNIRLNSFYLDYSNYMKAWSNIENAKEAHNKNGFKIARKKYKEASALLKNTKNWSYLSSNFKALSSLENAEKLSGRDEPKKSKKSFENSIHLFQIALKDIRIQISKIEKSNEKTQALRLIEALKRRIDYCTGRIEIEQAKILDKEGDYETSSTFYKNASDTFLLLSQIGTKQLKQESKLFMFLCKAWEAMALAEINTDPALYHEAAGFFRKSKSFAKNQKISNLLIAHSNLAKALSSSVVFEANRSKESIYKQAKRHLEIASDFYIKAGFETSSKYSKALQRLLEAYFYIDKGKRESNPTKETQYYQAAESVLHLSKNCFSKAKYVKKTKLVQRLIEEVTQEKTLAMSLSEIFRNSSLTSSTSNFALSAPREEFAVGLETFAHTSIQVQLIYDDENNIMVGKKTTVQMKITNIGKEAVLIKRINDLIPSYFKFLKFIKPEDYHKPNLVKIDKRIDSLDMFDIKLELMPFRRGLFDTKPNIIYADDYGKEFVSKVESKVINVLENNDKNKILTRINDLDDFLGGGIPKGYVVVLSSPSCEERDLIIKRFLQTGVDKNEIVFHITGEIRNTLELTKTMESSFFLFLCNQRANKLVKDQVNVFKFNGVKDLTGLDISVLNSSKQISINKIDKNMRICIDIASDVLLEYHSKTTREWVREITTSLKDYNFTILFILNSQMHSSEEVESIISLFDGEFVICKKETSEGIKKYLKITKLYNKLYFEEEILLSKEILREI